MKRKVSILMSLLLSLFLLVGCGGSSSPTKVTEDYFKDVKAGTDSKVAQEMMKAQFSDETMSKEAVGAVVDMLKKLEVTPTGEKIDGDKATVNVNIKGVSFKTVLGSFLTNMMGLALTGQVAEADMEKKTEEVLIKTMNEAPVEERTGVINLTKVDGEWKVTEDEAFQGIIFGITEADIDAMQNN